MGPVDADPLRKAFTDARKRNFEAEIFDHPKSTESINVYLTDSRGIVIFDSDGGRREGLDYWLGNTVLAVAAMLASRRLSGFEQARNPVLNNCRQMTIFSL